jgi:hypothetical protein
MTSPAIVEELCLLLNDIHVRLEMLKGVAATESNPGYPSLWRYSSPAAVRQGFLAVPPLF